MKQYDKVTATVRLRRGMALKPNAEALDGLKIQARALWQIESGDTRYPGEWAMVPLGESIAAFRDAEVVWIASGDLQIETANHRMPTFLPSGD